MGKTSGIFSSGLFQLVLSSAVIAAVITSAFSYQAVRKTNKRLLDIEIMKRESELTTFRYTKIFNAIEEIGNLPDVDYTYIKREGDKFVQDRELFGKVVAQTTERYATVTKVFERIRPLMDEMFLADVDSAIAEAEKQSNSLTQALYTNRAFPEGVDVVTLMQARQRGEAAIREAMNRQVSSLTKATSILEGR